MAGDHGGQPDQLEARVVELDVAQQEPVDPARCREPLVRARIERLAAHAQQQRVIAARQRAFDARQEAHEERIDLELLQRASEQQPDRARTRLRERPRMGARAPTELLGGVEDPLARRLPHPRLPVHRERDGRGRHAGARRDVVDRRPWTRRGGGGGGGPVGGIGAEGDVSA